MPPNLRELDSRIRALENLNLPDTKTELVEQRGLLKATAENVKEIKDTMKWVQRLVIGTVTVSIIGALLALAGLGAP